MKHFLILLALLGSPVFLDNTAHADEHQHGVGEVKCDCPTDCACRKAGGTCPASGPCSKKCNCHVFHGYLRPVIHPEMQQAIDHNENKATGPYREDGTNSDKPKGFAPTSDFYRGAKFINVKADPELIAAFKAKGGRNYKEISYSPVRGQIRGSCWAEGACSAFELNQNAIAKTKTIFSSQDLIDCSGFGTARAGGQASLEYALGGLALHADYRYTGVDGRCNKGVERHFPLKQVAMLRGENGGLPTEPELLTAFIKYGAMEGCGSSSAMGSGGRQDTIKKGQTDHCTAVGAAFPGTIKGWLDKWYWGNKNSWGAKDSPADLNLNEGDWGDGGWGWHVLSPDGQKITSSVWTEFQIGYAGDLTPPAPIDFFIEGRGVTLKITLQPTAAYNQEALTARINEFLKDAEG